jgi:hypothetical protein
MQALYGFCHSGKRKLFVSESILVGSAKDGESAIIENHPIRRTSFLLNKPDCLRQSFPGEAAHDKINLENITGSDSKYRFNRVNELLQKDAEIMKRCSLHCATDMARMTGSGMGNPLAVNQLIAHHAVIFAGTASGLDFHFALTAWKVRCHDLNKVFSITSTEIAANHEIYTQHLTIPADSSVFKGLPRFYEIPLK